MLMYASVIDQMSKHLFNKHAELLIGLLEMVIFSIGVQVNGLDSK
jgi:hypothetical protein